jgi:hypothetical protein
MPRSDLYDLAEKMVAARNAPVSPKRIEAAKRNLRTLVVETRSIAEGRALEDGRVLPLIPKKEGKKQKGVGATESR